jgi:hypothetical protein
MIYNNNLKIKCNRYDSILLLKVGLSFIKNKVMIKYLMYKQKLINMKNERLPITTSKINKSYSRLKSIRLEMQCLGQIKDSKVSD